MGTILKLLGSVGGAAASGIGFFTGGGWIPLAIVAVVAAGGGAWGAYKWEHAFEVAAVAERDSARHDLTTMTANRDSLQRSNDQLTDTLDREHAEQNAIDASSRKTVLDQQISATENANRLQAAKDAANGYLQQFKDQIHARPIVVGQIVHVGWDPLVVAGMQRLRCEQLAGNRGQDPAGCRVQAGLPAGGSRLAGDPAGAGDYRPSAEQQLDFLNDVWAIHNWGASCYDDKRAIAASQKAGPVTP